MIIKHAGIEKVMPGLCPVRDEGALRIGDCMRGYGRPGLIC